jgi:hypothetical protein
MKVSNFALGIIATCTLGCMINATSLTLEGTPSSVISIPMEAKMSGGGFTTIIPRNLTRRQAELLILAYEIAKNDGHQYPQLLQGILLQESNAGRLDSYKVAGQEFGLKTNERYYGIMQIKLAAARYVLTKYPQLQKDFGFHTSTDEEIIAKLIENDTFNLSVASKYLLVLKGMGYNTIQELSVAYNKGGAGARGVNPSTNPYALGVLAHIQQTVPLNKAAHNVI